MAIEDEIRRPIKRVVRRAAIKRRLATTGLLETSWQDITPYVISWGSFETVIDDIRLNRFRQSGLTLVVRNDLGKFNSETNLNSLWYGYLTRYKSLLRIQAG